MTNPDDIPAFLRDDVSDAKKKIEEFTGKRDEALPMYELLEHVFLERTAKVMTHGAEHYGVENWKNFSPEQVLDIQRHLFKHVCQFMAGEIDEDHLAHAACNLMFLMWYQNRGDKVTK